MIESLVVQNGAEIFDLFPSNPIARLILLSILILFGWQSKGVVKAWREDKRTAAHDEVDLVQMVEDLTSGKLRQMQSDLDEERRARQALERRALRLERRVGQLELYIEAKELPVPDWPKDWHLRD